MLTGDPALANPVGIVPVNVTDTFLAALSTLALVIVFVNLMLLVTADTATVPVSVPDCVKVPGEPEVLASGVGFMKSPLPEKAP